MGMGGISLSSEIAGISTEGGGTSMGTLYVFELFLPFNFGATPKRSVILIHKTSQDQFQKQNNFKDNKI